MTDALRVEGLHQSYDGVPVLRAFSLAVPAGGVVALTGPNGAGKSTVLGCVAGAVPFDRGALWVAGVPSSPSSGVHWQAVHGVLDDFAWLPSLTVLDHLVLLSPSRSRSSALEALEAFGIEALADQLPARASSGQRQRAALATLLVRPWSVLLLDEPERHLDASGLELLASVVLSSVAGTSRGVLVSTHSPVLLSLLGCPVVALS